jgi:hypothetical protein
MLSPLQNQLAFSIRLGIKGKIAKDLGQDFKKMRSK